MVSASAIFRSLLVAKGIEVTKGLTYFAIIAVANPIGPLLGMTFADCIDRKWVIVGTALTVAIVGTGFSQFTEPGLLILCGVRGADNSGQYDPFLRLSGGSFPTAIHTRGGGIAYSSSRVGAISSGFLITLSRMSASPRSGSRARIQRGGRLKVIEKWPIQ
jgi:putative MFS transporter